MFVNDVMNESPIGKVEVNAGFTLIRHGYAVPPSPIKGEGLSLRLSRLLCSWVTAIVRVFPLTGEGGWPKARRMRVKPKGCST